MICAFGLVFSVLACAQEHDADLPASRHRLIRPDEPLLPILKITNLDGRKVSLGRDLFHDTRLSHDNTVSCATCHNLKRGGVDHLPRSFGVGAQEGDINSPTVYNAVLNFRQFWDGRAGTLEEQADGPVKNPVEMASSWDEVLPRLKNDPKMAERFQAIYSSEPSDVSIRNAIAEFERSLVTPSRMDRWLLGEDGALNPQELKGYQLFKQYGCIACHQGANVGGNMYQRFGVMRDYFEGKTNPSKADMGRFNVTRREEDRHVFKVPSLRNVTLTEPYFHDASVQTLHEAVSLMGHYQLGIELPAEDVQSIVIFLHTLTGEELQ